MDYKDMYFKLAGKIADVIEELQQIQQETEKMYIEAEDKDDKN